MAVWIDAEDGYALSMGDGGLVARNAKGKVLKNVPSKVKQGPTATRLAALATWLVDHQQEALRTVETWMLGSLPVPTRVLHAVWPDPWWNDVLKHALVAVVDEPASCGLLVEVDPSRGLGVVDRDGESQWLTAPSVLIPHPVLLDDLDDWRMLLTELGWSQSLLQLFREVHRPPVDAAPEDRTWLTAFEGARFEQGRFAISRATRLGYDVRHGEAIARLYDRGQAVRAEYPITFYSNPLDPTETGPLRFSDARGAPVGWAALGPVALSEGVRMAARIHAGGVVHPEGP